MLRRPDTATYTGNDGWPTHTWREQSRTEQDVTHLLSMYTPSPAATPTASLFSHILSPSSPTTSSVLLPEEEEEEEEDDNPVGLSTTSLHLNRRGHAGFASSGLGVLSSGYQSLDASRPWIAYWCLLSLDVLGSSAITDELSTSVVSLLESCQNPGGGYGGGPGQMSHLAPTYAAMCALMIVGTEEALGSVDREAMRTWLLSIKQENGAFAMHEDGEVDARACYCALHVASVLSILDDEVARGVGDFLLATQGFDGGMGALPGNEPHGGYTYCAVGGLLLLGRGHEMRVESLLHWVVSRQMPVEGGFQGRTNKLVDGCYSFWQGAVPLMLDYLLTHPQGAAYGPGDAYACGGVKGGEEEEEVGGLMEANIVRLGTQLYSQEALQDYILIAAQNPRGGLRDKPGKSPDYYHTCYNLAGLSVSQHNSDGSLTVVGPLTNTLLPVDPVFAVHTLKAASACAFYAALAAAE